MPRDRGMAGSVLRREGPETGPQCSGRAAHAAAEAMAVISAGCTDKSSREMLQRKNSPIPAHLPAEA